MTDSLLTPEEYKELRKLNKTYKRETAFLIMSVEMGLILGSAFTGSEHLADLAQFLMPFASGLLMFAFGADWWTKQGGPSRD